MDQYWEATTVHGFSYVHTRNSLFERVVWVIVIVAGFSTAGWMVQQSLNDWSDNPIITTLDSIAAPIDLVQFPTVTVCSEKNTPPDNWSYLEKVLNFLSFDCGNAYSSYSAYSEVNCTDTQKLRDDYNGLITTIAESIKSLYQRNKNIDIWMNEDVLYSNYIQVTSDLLTKGDLRLKDISIGTQDNFSKHLPWNDLFNDMGNYSVLEKWPDYFYFCKEPKCNNKAYLSDMFVVMASVMMDTEPAMPFGTFLATFANMTRSKSAVWSSFDYVSKLPESLIDKQCHGMSSSEKYVHEYFTQLGQAVGFKPDQLLSLYEVPSMVASLDSQALNLPFTRSSFLYSQCFNDSKLNVLKSCFYTWQHVVIGKQAHPCDQTDSSQTTDTKYCCNSWTKKMGSNLKEIMQIMRFASRRGQSGFDAEALLASISKNITLLKYNVNPIGTGLYKTKMSKDMTTIIPACSYANGTNILHEDCFLFEPVITDLGICHSFNSQSSHALLMNSSFKDAFVETYGPDFIKNKSKEMGQGAGSAFALNFMVDRGSFWRHHMPTKPFRIAITEANAYFEAQSISKTVKPGYVTTFSIRPMEVVATSRLKDVSIEQRKCRFSHETQGVTDMFTKYSQSACEFECLVKKARKTCRCTPWNMPFLSTEDQVVCDVFGSYCFNTILGNEHLLKDCDCLANCNSIQFSINENEIPFDVDLYCRDKKSIGRQLIKDKKMNGYNTLLYKYYKLPQMIAMNVTELPLEIKLLEYQMCKQIMLNDIAIVSVQYETKKYVRTIMDKKVTFSDKLATFGGTLGLFTGMSILSMIEIVFWAIKLGVKMFSSKK